MAFPIYTRNPTATATDLGTGGQPYDITGWVMYNTNAAGAFVQVFALKATSVTVGSTTPNLVIQVPATTGNVWVGLPYDSHLHSEVGWSFAVTTTDNGNTALTYGNPFDMTFIVN